VASLLVRSSLDSSGLGSHPSRDIALCSWVRHLSLKVLFTPRCIIGTDEFNAGGQG